MRKVYKFIFKSYSRLIILGCFFFILFKTLASSSPYEDNGPSIKDAFKNKNSLGIDSKNMKSVQLEADQVQFSQESNTATAKGNVVVTSDKTILYAEQVQLDKAVGEAIARGHVYIDSPNMQVDATNVKYNFNTGSGEFQDARIFNGPFQIKGQTVSKLSEDHVVMEKGFLTTCDLDDPHYRIESRRMDVYPGDKLIARGIKIYAGHTPLVYFPKYVQDLKNQPIFTVIPGYKKDFGAYLLSTLRLRLSDQVKVTVHGDFRERSGIGEGVDVRYDTPSFGSGLLRTYYTYETQIASKHLWDMTDSNGVKKGPTSRHELYKIEWRHRWQIDQNTNAVWQYYKVHDYDLANMGFIKKYFEREYRTGPDVNTYFLLTRNLPKGVVTFRVDASRVNRPIRGVERLPEIQYSLSGERIGDSNFYLKTTDTFSDLTNKQPGNNMKTMRLDTNNEISYPKKIAFIETRPWVGGQHTYYTRTIDINENNVLRGQFKTGVDLTTHFYRLWNYRNKVWGVEMNGIRHVITPSIVYVYAHRPTIGANHFNQFDSIDALAQAHNAHLSLENKIQTKRNNQSVDLVRWILETDYSLLGSEPGKSFGPWLSTLEFNPADWLTFKADGSYNHQEEYWNSANFDTYINGGDKWSFGIGKRFAHHDNDQLTTDFKYKINPKWKFKVYHRFYLNDGTIQEGDYMITRDLHEWEMDIDYRTEKGNGQGLYILFRLKAFPGLATDLFSSTLHRPKAGLQNTTGN